MKDHLIDRVLKFLFLLRFKGKPEKVDEAIYEHMLGRHAEKVSKIYFDIFGVIDQKASTLLTHISMMIAANAVLLSVPSSRGLNVASTAILVSFVVVALLTLRLLRFWADGFAGLDKTTVLGEIQKCEEEGIVELQGPTIDRMKDLYNEEVWYRNKMYGLCLNFTTGLTLFSLLVFFAYGYELISKPDEVGIINRLLNTIVGLQK